MRRRGRNPAKSAIHFDHHSVEILQHLLSHNLRLVERLRRALGREPNHPGKHTEK